MRSLARQFFPPKPSFTEHDLPSLHGRVYIITGGYSGIGLHLAAMLYRAHATVYLAGRSESSALKAIHELETSYSSSHSSSHSSSSSSSSSSSAACSSSPSSTPAPTKSASSSPSPSSESTSSSSSSSSSSRTTPTSPSTSTPGSKSQEPHAPPKGSLIFMPIHLDDLDSVRSSAHWFLARESRLDVLWNNAGLLGGAQASTAQGHEIHIGTNCLGHFLLTKLLHPLLAATAVTARPASVRVVWLSSVVAHLSGARGGGIDLAGLDVVRDARGADGKADGAGGKAHYVVSKVGAVYVAAEWARRDATRGIVHLSLNPGNLKTPLQRHMGCLERTVSNAMLYDAKYGAYSELWAGLSPDVSAKHSGRYAVPWGRWGAMRADIEEEMREGAGRKSFQFFEWCEGKTRGWWDGGEAVEAKEGDDAEDADDDLT